MAAVQRPVVDDDGNIAVHGRSGLVLVIKIETSTEGEYEDISESGLFFEVAGKYRLELEPGVDDASRNLVLTRALIDDLPINGAAQFALTDETPEVPRTLWSGVITAFGFKVQPPGPEPVEGVEPPYGTATVIIQNVAADPVVVIRYQGSPGTPGSQQVDIPFWIEGRPSAAERVSRLYLPSTLTLAESRCRAFALTAGAVDKTFTIKVDGVTKATALFPAGETEGEISLLAATLGPGIIEMTAPALQDATLSDISITLSGDR